MYKYIFPIYFSKTYNPEHSNKQNCSIDFLIQDRHFPTQLGASKRFGKSVQ